MIKAIVLDCVCGGGGGGGCYCLISETTRFCNLDKLSMDRTVYERSELQRFCCKIILLRRYGSWPCLELLVSAEKLQKLTMLFHSQSH